jgi:hypothetical protein
MALAERDEAYWVATDMLKVWKAGELDETADVNALLLCRHNQLLPKTGAQKVGRK